jgi:hypothetical protein
MDLKSALQQFIVELTATESAFSDTAMRALSHDASFVEHSVKILNPTARFTLVKRMAHVRRIDPELIRRLEAEDARADQLREKRTAAWHLLERLAGRADGEAVEMAREPWVPTEAEIDRCLRSTAELRASLMSLAHQVATARED